MVAREAAESMGLSYTQKVQEKVWILNLETPIPLSCSTAKHISNLQLHNYFFPQRKITTPKAKGVWEAEPRKRSVWNIATESLFYELAISVIDRNKTLMYNKPLGQMSRNTTDERVLV